MAKRCTFFNFFIFALSLTLANAQDRIPPPVTSDNLKSVVEDKNGISGETYFRYNCASCHSIENTTIGPKLGGIDKIWTDEKLIEFIKNPAKFIESGDQRALALAKKYKLIMPAFEGIKDSDIKSIISYIKDETQLKNISPSEIDVENDTSRNVRYANPVKVSKLRVELEDSFTIPSATNSNSSEVNSLKPHPSNDGSLYVSSFRGIIYRIDNREVVPFLDINSFTNQLAIVQGSDIGLSSFAFHSDYINNGLLYTAHAEKPQDITADYHYDDSIKVEVQWVITEWKMKNIADSHFSGEKRELLRINMPSYLNGVKDLAFYPKAKIGDPDFGILYISIGDGGATVSGYPGLTHSVKSLLGTIIRIDPLGTDSSNGKYGIPKYNPFLDDWILKARKEIWAYGFHNPDKISWQETPRGAYMLITDRGLEGIEEINYVGRGQDFGWNVREGKYVLPTKSTNYILSLSEERKAKLYNDPISQYDHTDGNTIIGGYVYEGSHELLKDKYLFGDSSTGRLLYLSLINYDQTVYELLINEKGTSKRLKEFNPNFRLGFTISYDYIKNDVYLLSREEGKVYKVITANLEK